MGWLLTIVREGFGLFVHDGAFALAILACPAAGWFVAPRHALGPDWDGAILFFGLRPILLVRQVSASGLARSDLALLVGCRQPTRKVVTSSLHLLVERVDAAGHRFVLCD